MLNGWGYGFCRRLHYGAGHRRAGQTVDMEFFCYHRDRPGSVLLRDELLEEHWS